MHMLLRVYTKCIIYIYIGVELNDGYCCSPVWIGSPTKKKLCDISMTTLASLKQGSTLSLHEMNSVNTKSTAANIAK